MQYDIGLDDRLFPITKSYLYREMQRSCKNTGVKSDFIVFYLNRKCLGFCMRSQCACRSTPAPGRSAALTARWSACPHQNGGSNNTRFSAWCGTAHDRSSHRRFCGCPAFLFVGLGKAELTGLHGIKHGVLHDGRVMVRDDVPRFSVLQAASAATRFENRPRSDHIHAGVSSTERRTKHRPRYRR